MKYGSVESLESIPFPCFYLLNLTFLFPMRHESFLSKSSRIVMSASCVLLCLGGVLVMFPFMARTGM